MPTDSLISGLQNLPHFYFAAGASLRMTINMDADFSLTGKICEVSIAPKEKKPIRAFTLTSADSDIAISGQVVTIAIEPTKETAPAFTGGWTLADVQAAGETELAVSFYASGEPVDLRLQGDVTWVTKGGEFDNGEAVVAAPSVDVAVSSGVVSVTVSVAGGSTTLDTNTATSGLSGILKAASNTLDVAVAGTDYVATNDSRLTDSRTPTAHKASHSTGGGDALTPGDIGAATAAQGALAASAVQPNTSPTFSALTVNGGGNVASFTGNVSATVFSVNPHIAIGYPSGSYQSFSAFGQLSWTNDGFDFLAPRDVGLGRDSAGRLQVNDGITIGQFRDLILRDVIATQYIRPASYTVAAANALSSPPEGAMIYVSNETGGATPAFRRGSSWLRTSDNAAIS